MAKKLMEGAALALALSVDTFVAGFSYGADGVKMPRSSLWVINLVCDAVLGLALLTGAFAGRYLPEGLSETAYVVLLFIMGIIKLLDGMTKNLIRRHGDIRRRLKFCLFNFRVVLTLYADPEAADSDGSKTLSPMEAASLAFALSLDAMAAGFGAAAESGDILPLFVLASAMNAFAVPLGVRLGAVLSKKLTLNISWLSGVILMVMAVLSLTHK